VGSECRTWTRLAALCALRWSWLARVDSIEQALFEASVTVAVGSGESTLFWRDKWLDGQCMSSLAPDLLLVVNKRAVKTRTVAQALQSNSWVADITGSLSALAMWRYLALWERLQGFQRRVSTPPPRRIDRALILYLHFCCIA
jgi:hypothetical protein